MKTKIRVKKSAPQLVSLTVLANSRERAESLWKTHADNTVERANLLNATGDPNLQISQMGNPVVKEQFRNVLLNTLVGGLAGLGIGSILLAFINYFKENK